MASLPEEIWLLIFKFIQDDVPNTEGAEFGCDLMRTAPVRPLTETCRTFHRICQPLLFETLVLRRSVPSFRVVEVLQSKPHLRSMVTKVRINWARALVGIPDRWNWLEKALGELHSVRDLWIQGANISTGLWDHIQRFPRLERLVLIGIGIIGAAEPTTISFHSLKHLRYQPILKLQVTNFYIALLLPELETLHIASEFLSGAADLCSHQVFQFSPSTLKELIIEYNSSYGNIEAGLLELLERANRIRSLKLRGLVVFSRGFSLRNDLIPDLEKFRGPACSILTFCKGRPVRELFTWFDAAWEMTDDIPNLIRPGLVPLEHLHISWTLWRDDTMGYIARHCPQLVSLRVRAKHVDIEGTLSTRHHMPKLRKATFLSSEGSWFVDGRSGNSKVESEAKVVQECWEFWTQLEYLRLDPRYFWRYQGPGVEQVQGEEEEWFKEL